MIAPVGSVLHDLAMTWHRQPLVAFDLETTGIDPHQDRVVTAAVLHIDPRDGQVETYSWLINPGCDIPEPATAVHGITTEHAQTHGREPAEALLEIAAHIGHAASTGAPLVVYNAPYDLTMLHAECARHDTVAPTVGPVIDPLVIDRGLDRYRPGSRKLTATAAHYGVPISEDEAHGASADALAAARVAWKLATGYPEQLGSATLVDLQAQQAAWHEDWAAGFEQYLHRQGREDAEIPRGWPTR